MKQRIDTEDNWKAKNPVLLNGELGLISGDPRYKIGNGTSPWNDLPFRGVGIEEYDNRTLVQADGLVGTDDVHYFLPNANPTDKKHTFAMLSDIPEGGEGGANGGGSGASSGPLRVWVNGGDGGENNSEMIAENAATFKAMWSEKPQQVILCDTLELDGYQIKGAYPVAGYYLTSEEGTNAILMTYTEVVNGENGLELIETVVNLFEDGTVTVTIA